MTKQDWALIAVDEPIGPHSHQVWSTDITYIPMAHGFVYCVAVIDWYSRMVLSWRLSNTMDASFCVDALDEALRRYGTPEIFNTDQGSQFTGEDFIGALERSGAQISMDGKGCWRDNVFVERLWRSLKYEEVYLHAYDDVPQARSGIGSYFDFFNDERPHQALATACRRRSISRRWRGCSTRPSGTSDLMI
jgi:putative transposase